MAKNKQELPLDPTILDNIEENIKEGNEKEETYDIFFLVFLGLKAAYGVFEVIAGLFLLFVSNHALNNVFISLIRGEFLENAPDSFSSFILKHTIHLSPHTQFLVALYFLIYGVLKIFLIVDVLRNKIQIYPIALTVFFLILAYQVYKLIFSFSILLFILTIFDALTLALVWHHYLKIKRSNALKPQ